MEYLVLELNNIPACNLAEFCEEMKAEIDIENGRVVGLRFI